MANINDLINNIASLTVEENESFGNLIRPDSNYEDHELCELWKIFFQNYLNRQLMLRRSIQEELKIYDALNTNHKCDCEPSEQCTWACGCALCDT